VVFGVDQGFRQSLLCAQKERWESSRVKRPCNAYIKFIQNFMTKNVGNFDNVREAVSAGNNC